MYPIAQGYPCAINLAQALHDEESISTLNIDSLNSEVMHVPVSCKVTYVIDVSKAYTPAHILLVVLIKACFSGSDFGAGASRNMLPGCARLKGGHA